MSFFPNLPLRTARLVLRPPEMGDAEALLAMHADPEVMRYWATPPWHAVDQAVDRIEKDRASLLDGSAIRLLLQPTDGGPVLGAATLFAFVPECGRAEVGYILSREAWGLGLMQEALGALLHYGFGELGLRRVEADIDPRNARSATILERLGFIREGYLRERWVVGGEISDTALYGLLAREFIQHDRS